MRKQLAVVSQHTAWKRATIGITDSQQGLMLLDINRRPEVQFTTNEGARLRVVLRIPDEGDPVAYERMSQGLMQRFVIYRLNGLWIDGELKSGVEAIGYSEHTRQLILLQEASNIVGGVYLRSRPVSSVKYRMFGARSTSMAITEVSVVR